MHSFHCLQRTSHGCGINNILRLSLKHRLRKLPILTPSSSALLQGWMTILLPGFTGSPKPPHKTFYPLHLPSFMTKDLCCADSTTKFLSLFQEVQLVFIHFFLHSRQLTGPFLQTAWRFSVSFRRLYLPESLLSAGCLYCLYALGEERTL